MLRMSHVSSYLVKGEADCVYEYAVNDESYRVLPAYLTESDALKSFFIFQGRI